jgi:hypothetical protein
MTRSLTMIDYRAGVWTAQKLGDETAKDWRGEGPDLPLRVSKVAEVVESVVGRGRKAAEPRPSAWH